MSVEIIIGLVGGLAIFLYGMLLMNENLTQVGGNKLKGLLLKLTGSKLKGYLTGLGITLLNQSSSATTVLEAAFVGAGLITFQQSIAVTLGSELGSTITAQLVAFKITKYALLFVAIGFFPRLVCKSKVSRSILGAILGFGMLFLGMELMSKSLHPLRDYQPFLKMMSTIENPFYGILFGMFFTMIVQSSGATSGITVSMAISGTITLAQAIPINLGACIGTCITAVLGSMALNRDAKRAAYIHILFQVVGVFTVFIFLCIPFSGTNIWICFVEWFCRKVLGTQDLARQIAMAHTFMPIINHMLVIPTLPFWVKVMDWIYPPKEVQKPFGPDYINDSFLDTPEIALVQAKKEIERVGAIVRSMMENTIQALKTRDLKLVDQICLTDNKADILRNAIVPYLTKLAQSDLTHEEATQEVEFLYIVNDLEAIGDIVDKNIMPMIVKMVDRHVHFSEKGMEEITLFHQKILGNIVGVLDAFNRDDIELAEKITLTKPEIGRYESELRMNHIKRLHSGQVDSMDTSSIHFDLASQYKRINSHIVSIAYVVKGGL